MKTYILTKFSILIFNQSSSVGSAKFFIFKLLSKQQKNTVMWESTLTECFIMLPEKEAQPNRNLKNILQKKKHEVFIYRYPEIDAEILPIFDIVPMKFGDGEKEVSDYWKKYYEELGVPVPVGQPGTNPGQLAKSEKLKYIGKLD